MTSALGEASQDWILFGDDDAALNPSTRVGHKCTVKRHKHQYFKMIMTRDLKVESIMYGEWSEKRLRRFQRGL